MNLDNFFRRKIIFNVKIKKFDIIFFMCYFLIKNIRGERNVSIYNCNSWVICGRNKKFN